MYKQIASNVRLTWGLIALFLIFIIFIGWVLSVVYNNPYILVIAVAVALIQTFTSYYYSDQIALLSTGAREAKRSDYLELHRIVENLSITAGFQKPKIYVIADAAPNAFATGRNPMHASLAVTEGLLKKMNKVELEGVVSHELSHIGNYDILLMSIVVVLVGVIALIADFALRMSFFRDNRDSNGGSGWIMIVALVLWVVAPISAVLIQLAISRRREYLADASGALLTRYPEGLAGALEKLEKDKTETRLKNRATAHLFIASPFWDDKIEKKESFVATLFSTHPPMPERIKKLRAMILT